MGHDDNTSIKIAPQDGFAIHNGPLPSQYLQALAGYANDLTEADLNNPCISYYGRLRYYSLQNTCQELNGLSKKCLVDMNPSREDLERLRFLLHEHGNLPYPLIFTTWQES
jgi:hypothetical protein